MMKQIAKILMVCLLVVSLPAIMHAEKKSEKAVDGNCGLVYGDNHSYMICAPDG